MTQEDLASRLGVSFQQVQKYEKGANRISASTLYHLATVLGVRPGYFFDDYIAPHTTAPEVDQDTVILTDRDCLTMAGLYARMTPQQQQAFRAMVCAFSGPD